MSGEKEKSEADLQEGLTTDFEKAADEAFGTDEEIEANLAKEAEEAEEAAPAEKAQEDEPGDGEEKPAEKAQEDEPGDGEEKPAEDIAAKSEKDEEKPDDDDPYDIPKDIKGRTRDRMEKFRTDLKEAHESSKKKDDVIQGFKQIIDNTGMSPQEVQRTLDLGALLKKDPARALNVLNDVVKDLSAKVGVTAPGVDPLAEFEDLRQQVDDKLLTKEGALEIAGARIQKKATETNQQRVTEQNKQQQETEQQQGQYQQRVETARTDVAGFIQTVENDPDWDKIAEKLTQAAMFASENLAPEKWLSYLSDEHKKIKDIAAMSAPRSNNTPMMGGGAPKGGDREPQDLEDLANMML